MPIDLYAKAVHLLEKIANSIHEREQKKTNLLYFSSSEVVVVQEWLKDFAHCVGTNKPANET